MTSWNRPREAEWERELASLVLYITQEFQGD